jgi:hypothetical protein
MFIRGDYNSSSVHENLPLSCSLPRKRELASTEKTGVEKKIPRA